MKKLASRLAAILLAACLLYLSLPARGGLEARAAQVMTSGAFVNKLLDIAMNYKTLYVNGGWGWPMNRDNQDRAVRNWSYNAQPEREAMIRAATDDTFGFDCSCLIKAILWGWTGDVTQSNGGAKYGANGVADFSTRNVLDYCTDVSETFDPDAMVPGEILWMSGHVGVYVGGGQVVECTPAWSNDVQISQVDATGARSKDGVPSLRWVKHGKLNYIAYNSHTHTGDCGWDEGYCSSDGWRPNQIIGLTAANDGTVIRPGTYLYNGGEALRSLCPYALSADGNEALELPAGTEAELITAVKNGLGEVWYKVRLGNVTAYGRPESFTFLRPAPSELVIAIGTGDAPVGNLPLGKAFPCGGVIRSNYPITEVTGALINDAGSAVCRFEGSPGRTSFSIKSDGLDAVMVFNKLPAGHYLYRVTARDETGTARTFYSSFSMVSGTDPAVTYAISYDANGGTDAPDIQLKTRGEFLSLRWEQPSRDACTFTGWNTAPDGSGTSYAPGDPFTADQNTVLYACWMPQGPEALLESAWGDANGNGSVSNTDIVRLKNYLANYDEDTGLSTVVIFAGADANGDGAVNNSDVVRLKNYLANYDEDTGLSTVILGPDDPAREGTSSE